MPASSTALSQIYIGSVFNAAPQLSDFEAQSWQQIGEVTDLGTFGAKAKELSSIWITDGLVHKYKGSVDSGNLELVVDRDPFDAGQIAVKAAAASTSAYLFKVTLNDSPTEDGTPTSFYFRAIVTSAENKVGTADTIISTTFALAITGAIIEVPATVTIAFTPAAGALPAATHAGRLYRDNRCHRRPRRRHLRRIGRLTPFRI